INIAILRLAPGRAHAEAARAGSFRRLRLGDDCVEMHELLRFHAGLVSRALGTVGAILRTAAGLDGEKRGNLHLGGIEVQAVNALRAKYQLGKWKRKERAHLRARPVMANDTRIRRRSAW